MLYKNKFGCGRRQCVSICQHELFVFFSRLTPAYMVVLLMAEVSSRWLRNISVFEPENNNYISCANYWWRNILYINSFYPKSEMVLINNNNIMRSILTFIFFLFCPIIVYVVELVYVQRHAVLCFSSHSAFVFCQVNN